jgi:phytoene synthase
MAARALYCDGYCEQWRRHTDIRSMNIQIPHQTAGPAPAASRAGGSSFYLAMRILGREKREAMFDVYSFCREVDDIADSDAPRLQRVADLAAWRQNIDSVYSNRIPPGLEQLAKAIARFGLRKGDFLAVIDGVEMDAREDILAPSLERLELYCDRVACAVGRLCVRIFGMNDPTELPSRTILGARFDTRISCAI